MAEHIGSYKEIVEFDTEKFNPITLVQNERVKVILTCFKAGQFIPVHKPGIDLTLTVLEGRGSMMVGEREETIERGSVAFVPAGEARGIKAETDMVIFNTVTPPPGAGDHDTVKEKLQEQSWR